MPAKKRGGGGNFKGFQQIEEISIFVLGAVNHRSVALPWYESAARDQRWWLMSYDSAYFVLGAVTCRSVVLLWYEGAARDQKWWLLSYDSACFV